MMSKIFVNYEIFKTEWHQVASEFIYDISDDEITKSFGSIQRFKEIYPIMLKRI